MLTLGALSFLAPSALAALLVLPVIWWFLRLTPPVPTIIRFPPVRLLMGLATREESAAHTPLWLLILRLVLAALVILGAAHPLLNAGTNLTGKGPLIAIIDDGWAAAGNWQARRDLLRALVDQAERDGRPVIAVTTAPEGAGEIGSVPSTPAMVSAADARQLFLSLQPKPWPTDRNAALRPLMKKGVLAGARPGDVVWLSDGLEEKTNGKTMADLLRPLQRFGGVTLVRDPAPRLALVLRPPVSDAGALIVGAERAAGKGMAATWLRAVGDDGSLLARQPMTFAAGKTQTRVKLTLPTELLNSLQRLEIEDIRNAGAVVLADERWRRRPVGLVSGSASAHQPLLSDLFYLERALKPFAEIRIGNVDGLLKRPLAVMVLSDPGQLVDATRQALENWIEAGGIAVRFAGPLLAKATAEFDGSGNGPEKGPLLPVRLRRGDRVIGGAMSWSKPAKLAPFEAASPFYGLTVPGDVSVKRQVLAQPSLDLAGKTWARLDDGTPLVTAMRMGKGWLVLAHITAGPQWSNLPLSGLFVDLLKRLVALSQGVAARASGPPLEPLSTINGFGRLGTAAAHARAIAADAFDEIKVSPAHPPGFYGSKKFRRALNLSATLPPPEAIGDVPGGITEELYGKSSGLDFRPWLLIAALVLVLVDFTASLRLRGLLRLARVAAVTAALLFGLGVVKQGAAKAEPPGDDAFALGNSLETRLAYVITGDKQADDASRAGLYGLTVVLKRRTAAELGPPQGVDPARDELSFFPLLYWPVTENAVIASDTARSRVNEYLKNGGTILFDTLGAGGEGSASALRRLTRGLDIPPLVPVPPDHVLTRAFYLLSEFPGRWTGGTLWVERAGERVNDGVSPVIVGGNDWARAWALDEAHRPLFPVVPGGERQREMAFRFGINLVMHTLTGNYKADQVHMPAIIKRLGK